MSLSFCSVRLVSRFVSISLNFSRFIFSFSDLGSVWANLLYFLATFAV